MSFWSWLLNGSKPCTSERALNYLEMIKWGEMNDAKCTSTLSSWLGERPRSLSDVLWEVYKTGFDQHDILTQLDNVVEKKLFMGDKTG